MVYFIALNGILHQEVYMASYNTSLINTSNTGLLTPQQANEKTVGLTNNTRNKAYTQGVKNSLYEKPTYDKETLSTYTDEVMNRRFSKDFTTALSKQAQKYNEIAEYYKNFYTNGIAYDKDGNAIQGADALSYADRYQFAEFLHELYPELSVDYFVKNAENFMYRATGVKTDIKNYGDHLGNIWNASWKNAGYSIWTAMEYLGGALSGGFGSVEWENTKKELAKKKALSGADYRKDLGDERYDSLAAKMLSGTIEQSPQMAMMLATMAVSIATGGLSGAGGIVGKLALNSMSQAVAVGNASRIAMTAANFVFSGLMDAGSFMTELSDAGASDEAAFIAGLFILASTGFLETWGDDTLLAPVDKVANAIFKKKDSQIINSATKSAMKIIRETGFNWLMDIGASEITETVQEEVEYLAEVFAKELVVAYEAKYGNMLDKEELGITGDQVIESMKETARQTLLSTPLMTLGSNVIATGLDIGWGDIAAQRRPNKYMNKEGATNIRGTSEFVAFGPDIIDPNKQDADNGKANPIKAHTVGNYTFIDEKLSQQQYDLLTKGENKGIYTVEDNSKFTDKSVVALETEAIETGVKMTADTLDSYLAAIDRDGNLDSYGYETKGKITAQNEGDATTLYITLKDSQETIKIDIADKNSPSEKLNSIKDFTNVDFSEIERAKRDESTVDEDSKKKKKEKKEKKKKKKESTSQTSQEATSQDQSTADTTARKTEGSGTTWRDSSKTTDEPAPDMFKGTSKEGTTTAPQSAPQATTQAQDQTTTTEPTKKYAADKAKSSKAFLKQYTSQAFETAEFLDKDGNVVPNATSGAYIALTDSKGNTEVVRTDGLSDSTVRRILSTAKSSQVDPKQAKTDSLKDNNKGKAEAQTAVGVDQTGSPAPETIGKQTEQKKKVEQAETVKAEKAKNAESFFASKERFPGLRDLYDDGSPRNGVFDVDDMFDGTYELVNDKGQTVNTLEEATAFIGKGKDGKEVVFSTKQILKGRAFKEQYELYVSEAKQIKAKTAETKTTEAKKVTKAQFNAKVDEVVKNTGVSRKSAEDSVLIAIGAMNAVEKSGVKVTLDEATQQVVSSQLPLEIETAPDDGKSHLESDVNKVVTIMQSLDKQGETLKKIMEKPSEKVKKAGSLSAAVLSYIQDDMTHADLPDSTLLIFDEIKETVRALHENNATTLSSAEREDLKLLKGENDSKKEEVKPQGSAEAVTVDEGSVVDTTEVKSSYRYNEETGRYYIDRQAVSEEFLNVLKAAKDSLTITDLDEMYNNANLAAIFLTSLSEEAQDALVRRSIASNGNGSLLGGDENLLRLFFTFKEVTQALPNNAKGASLPDSAKILLSSLSDKSTVVHEVGHILWTLDENFRNRAKTEFKKYFEEDPTGAGIRTVVEASPSRFGGMTADTVIEALRKLTDENFDYLKESKTEESVMYMFEAWDEKRDTPKYTKGIKGLFERIAEFFRDVADKIKTFFGVDILHETTNAVYSPLFEDVNEYRKFSEKLATEGWTSSSDSNTRTSRRLVVSEDGHTEVWKGEQSMILVHALSEKNLLAQLDDNGDIAMPSLAVTTPDSIHFVEEGDQSIILVGNADMVKELMQDGKLFSGDIYSPSTPDIDTAVDINKLEDLIGHDVIKANYDIEKDIKDIRNNYTGDESLIAQSTEFDTLYIDQRLLDAKNAAFPAVDPSFQSAFSELGDFAKNYYAALFAKSLREAWISRKSSSEAFTKQFEAKFNENLYTWVLSEICWEISTLYSDVTPQIARDYALSLAPEERREIYSIYKNLEAGSEIYSKFEKPFSSSIGGIDVLESNSYVWKMQATLLAGKLVFWDGSDVNAANPLRLRNALPLKNGDDSTTNNELRVLGIPRINSFDELHQSGNKISPEASDFGDMNQALTFNVRYAELQKDIKKYVGAKNADAVLNFVIQFLTNKPDNEQGNLNGIGDALKIELASMSFTGDVQGLIDTITTGVKDIYAISATLDTPYYEGKPRKVINVKGFVTAFVADSASQLAEDRLRSLQIPTFRFDDATFNEPVNNKRDILASRIRELGNSVWGQANRVMCQTMEEYIEAEQQSKASQKITSNMNRFKELVFYNIKEKLLPVNDPVSAWRRNVEKKKTFAEPSDINQLIKIFENNGLYDVINNQKATKGEKEKFKRDIAQRFAYEFEDYTTFATKVGEVIDSLVDEKGRFKSDDSLEMKKALFFLYGYKKFTNKDGSVTTTASGLLSRMFMNDSAKSLYQSRASEGIMKKFTVVKDSLAEKGIDNGLDNDTKRTFLTKKTWANKTTNGMQLTLDSNLDYSSLDFKLSDKGISTEDVYNFLSLMVEKTEDGYIPFAWKENNSNLDEGQAENSFAIQGPLIDILNYDHKDHENFTGNSFNTVDSNYATTAYNTFYNAGIPLMEGTLSYSSTLLDQYKTDYLTAYEVLKGSDALNEILDNGVSIAELEVLRKLLGESIAETKTEITEAENVEELFKTSTSKSEAIFEIDSILKEMEKQEREHLEISKDSLERFQDVLTSYQNDINADSQKQFEESLRTIEERSKEREERLQAEAEEKEKRASKTVDSLKDKVSSLELELEEEKLAHQTKVQNVKDRLNAKLDEIVEKNAEKQEKTKQRYEEKLAQKSELLKNSREKVSDLIAQRQTARQRANEIIEEIFSTGKKIREGSISEDAQTAVKYYQDLLNNLRKEIEKRDKIEAKLQGEIDALKKRLTEKLGVATATAKDFNNAGVLPIFDAGIKELKRVARESGTAEVAQKLSKIVDTVALKKNVGTEVDLLDLFDYRTLYTSDNSENFVKYREDMDSLRVFVVDNMIDRGSAPNLGVVSKHIKELNTQQLSEFIDLVSAVSKDSRSYFNDMVEKDNEYYNRWIDSIVSEINTFAKLKGKNLSELTNEDSIGTTGSKSGLMGKLGDLMNDFTVNSVKYRDRFPTLYAFLYGGLDHEGKVYGGLNSATDDVARNFRADVNSINKIIIDKLSGTVFYEKELDDKNLRVKWNEVKSSYKTTLGMSAFTEADKQALGYSVESFIDPLGVRRYRLNIDENSSSAMKEVARYLGGIELQKIKAKDKLSDLKEKIEKKKTAIDNNLKTIANAERNLDYWKTGKYYVTGEKYGQLIEESDRKKQIETLEKRIKNTKATLERNREILQARQEKVPILEQRIASYDDIGLRPNPNTSNYSTQELLGIYMYARQEGGINRLIYNPRVVFKDEVVAGSSNTNNLDIGNVIWVIKQFEDPTSIYAPLKEVADELTKLASKNFDAIRKTKFFLSNGEVLLDPIDYYFSFITDSSTIIDIQDQIDIGELGKNAETKPDSKAQRAKANDKMTKERKTNARGLELRVLDRVYSSLYQQEYYISMGERISRLKELVQDERFQSAMKSYYGRNKGMANLVSLSKYVNSLSNSQRDLDPTALSGFVRFWTNNTAAGAMAFSLPTVLQQFPTMLWCLKDPYIGLKGILKALYKASTDKSLYKYSPQMEERANSAIQSIRATKNVGSFFSEKFNNYTLEQAITKTQDVGLKLLDKADSFIANAMWYATFEGVKQEYIEAGKDVNLSPDEFMNLVATEATQRVLDISPVQGGKDNATAYSTNNAYVRNMLLFTNQTTKMLNGLVGSFRDFDVKGWQYLAKTLGVSLAIFMLNGIINGKMWRKTDDDDDDEAHINLLTNIPYVLWEGALDLVPGADSIFSTDQYGETNIVKDLSSIRKALTKDPDDRTEHQLSNAWFNLLSDTLDAGGLSGNALRKVYRAARDQNLLQLYNSKYAELLEE